MNKRDEGFLKAFGRRLRRNEGMPCLTASLYDLAMGWLREGAPEKAGQCNYAFCDGGQTGRNGAVGTFGTYGTVLMEYIGQEEIDYITHHVDGGVIGPDAMQMHWKLVTNNQAEFVALIRLLCWLPDGWEGFIVCDSEVTVTRYHRMNGSTGIEKEHLVLLEMLKERLGSVRVLHWPGHTGRNDHLSIGNDISDKIAGLAGEWYKEWRAGLDKEVVNGLKTLELERMSHV